MDSSHVSLRTAAAVALCGLFAVLAVGLALLAAGVCQDVEDSSQENFTHRTALSYLMNQVRRADAAGELALGTFGGQDALFLTESLEGTQWITVLYCWEGALRELYTEAGTQLTPADGLVVTELQDLTITQTEDILTFTATSPDGAVRSATVIPRCGWEEVPV